jgi:hypothetical protein
MPAKFICLAAFAVVGTDEVGIKGAVKPRGAHLSCRASRYCGESIPLMLRQDEP